MNVNMCRFFLLKLAIVLSVGFLPISKGCSSHDFQCPDGRCIPLSFKCDGEGDCSDSSDELHCRTTVFPASSYDSSRTDTMSSAFLLGAVPAECQPNEFPCDSHRCIPYLYRCDGDNDCADKSDEKCEPFLDNFLIVAETGRYKDLYQIDLSSGIMVPLNTDSKRNGGTRKNAVAFDGTNKVLYWTDIDVGSIRRIHLAAENRSAETIFTTGNEHGSDGVLEGLALDVANDKLYCAHSNSSSLSGHGVIWEMTLNGSNRKTLLSEPGQPRSIVIDTTNRFIYWTDWGSTPAVVRASLDDGSGRTILVSSDIKWPNGLAIDFKEKVLYWCDAWHHRIERINLNGSGRRVVLREMSTNASYFSIALGSQVMYITDRRQRSVRKLDLKSWNVSSQIPADIFDRLNGVLYYNSSATIPESFPVGGGSTGRPGGPGSRQSKGLVNLPTTSKFQEPVGIRRTNTQKTPTTPSIEETTSGDIQGDSTHQANADRHSASVKIAPDITDSSVVTVIVVVVVGVVVMTIVITIGVVIVKAKRNRSRLLLEKRPVVPISERGINSYNYSPFVSMAGLVSGPGGGSTTSCSDDGEMPCSSRPAAVRSSSCKPIITEDALALNNIYSTVVGDYENLNPYEMIDDSFM